jgi:hypothetical protein
MDTILKFFIDEGTQWIQRQRDKFRNKGRSLKSEERKKLNPYFTEYTLDAVSVAFVHNIENPEFYQQLQEMGQPIPLDFSTMGGITFIDTIVVATSKVDINSELWSPLLFHECVHVCQYNQLGLQSFIERYVLGWAERGFKYRNIPLEGHAYSLQYKFETENQPFPVEQSVRDWLRKNNLNND